MAGSPSEWVRVELRLPGTRVRPGRLEVAGLRLRWFQEEALRLIAGGRRVIVVDAPTGSGKTVIPLLPLAHYIASPGEAKEAYDLAAQPWRSASIYPSRALLDDQERNIGGLLARLGAQPAGAPRGYPMLGAAERSGLLRLYRGPESPGFLAAVLRLHGEATDRLRELYEAEQLETCPGAPSKLALLGCLYDEFEQLHSADRPLFVFSLSTPEYLSLVLEGLYGPLDRTGEAVRLAARLATEAESPGELIKRIHGLGYRQLQEAGLRREDFIRVLRLLNLYSDLVFVDEAHLYTGPSLPALAGVLAAYLAVSSTGRLVLSSATHREEALQALLGLAREITGQEPALVREPGTEGEPVRKPTRLIVLGAPTRALNRVASNLAAQYYLPEAVRRLAPEIRELSAEQVMIIGDRLYYIWRAAEEALRRLGGNVACIDSLTRHGLGPGKCTATDPASARVIVGSSAISYGVDIPGADAAVIYGKTASDIVQRIGRTGRRPGEGLPEAVVYLLTGKRNARRLQEIGSGIKSQRSLEEALRDALGEPSRKTPGLDSLWAAKALAALSSIALALRASQGADSRTLEKIFDGIARAADALAGSYGERALRILASAGGLSSEVAAGLAMPRPIPSIRVGDREVPLHQYLRAYPADGEGGGEYDKYDFFINIDTKTFDKIIPELEGQVLSAPYILTMIDNAARQQKTGSLAIFSALPGSASKKPRAHLVQVSSEGASHVSLSSLAGRIRRGPAAIIRLDSWAGEKAAAYTLLAYYNAPAIPILSVDPGARHARTFPEIVEASARHAVMVIL